MGNLKFLPENNFFALGPTFRSHQKEIGRDPSWPDLWMVPNQSVIHEDESILIPEYLSGVKPGVELTAVMSHKTWQASPKQAWENIAGFTISNDVTVTGQWPGWPEPGRMKTNFGYKMFPTFAPVLYSYQQKRDVEHYEDLDLNVKVDGNTSIVGNTSSLHFAIPEMISYVSHICQLNEGDLIALGDPGYADIFLDNADTVSCFIESIGKLSNTIRRTESTSPPLK
jgi:2-keto-4-pentenoate hydratase/2-oxohepta-3-ene-1,7-dioic acid hydratase in catechol pathway